MPAVVNNIQGTSEPFLPLVALFVPASGSINDVKVAYDRSVLGPLLNINDGGAGVWVLTFTNNFPALGNLIVTTGIENDSPSSGDITSVINVAIATAVLTVNVFAQNDTAGTITFPARDRSAWVKVEKSVF